MKVRRVAGDARAATITVTALAPRTAAARTLDIQLGQVAHLPESRTVVVQLAVVERRGDAFHAAVPSPLTGARGSELTATIRLPELRGRDLHGYTIEVRDGDDAPLAKGTFQ